MSIKSKFKMPQVRKLAGVVLPAAAMTLLVANPALAADGTNAGAMAEVFTAINELAPGIRAVVAVVGFIVALISLVALRSFSAVLFFLGVAVFGAGGLAVAQTIIGATASLI